MGLDEPGARLVEELVREVKGRDGAVVLATHERERARRMCDAVAVLDSGTLVEHTPSALGAGSGRPLRHTDRGGVAGVAP